MLPYSNLAEAESMMENFVADFHKKSFRSTFRSPPATWLRGIGQLTIMAGIAEGQSTDDIDSVIELAKSQQKKLGGSIDATGE